MASRIQIVDALCALVIAVFLGAQLLGGLDTQGLRYERGLIESGEYWRLPGGNFDHLGLYHAFVNCLALCIWHVFYARAYNYWYWPGLILVHAVGVGICLFLFSPEVAYYAGFSGVLHGLFLFSALRRSSVDATSRVIVLLVLTKLVYEQSGVHDVGYLADRIGAPVVTDAHIYGGLVGLVLAVLVGVSGFARRTGRND